MQRKNSLTSFHIYMPQSLETGGSRAVCTGMNTNEFIFTYNEQVYTSTIFTLGKKQVLCVSKYFLHMILREVKMRK